MPDLTGLGLILVFVGILSLTVGLHLHFRGKRGISNGSADPDVSAVEDETTEATLARLLEAETQPKEKLPHQTAVKVLNTDAIASILREAHHIAILGGTGDGKTTTGEALTRVLLPGVFSIIDMNWKRGKWGGLACATVDDMGEWHPIRAELQLIDEEISTRRMAVRDGQDAELFPMLNILWDEVNETVEELGDMAGTKLRRWLRTIRQFRARLVLFLQSDRVAALGIEGHGDARKNLVWLYLGEEARTLALAEVRAKREPPEFAQAIVPMRYPGVIRWRGSLHAADMTGFVELAEEVRKAAAPHLHAAPQAAAVPFLPISTPARSQSGVPGVDDVEMFTMLARLVGSGRISETVAIEVGFGCGAGGGKVYQTALARLRAAQASGQPSEPSPEPEAEAVAVEG